MHFPRMLRVFGVLAAAAGASAFALPALSADYPAKPVTILVPYAPGGATDIVARVLAEELRKELGQAFVVENKPGANGIIALEALAKAKPDGYTLLVGNVSTNAITPLLYRSKISFDYLASVTAVSSLAKIPNLVVASTNGFDAKALGDFVAKAKQADGGVTYTSAGVGSYPHFDMLVLADKAGFKATHIPSKEGAAGMLKDLINGDAQVAFVNVASSAGLVKTGKLQPLATITDERLPDFPGVPTLKELGYPGVGTFTWQALFAPAGVPDDVLRRLTAALNKVIEAEAVKAAFAKSSIIPALSKSPEEAKAWLASEMSLWQGVVGKYDLGK